MKMNKKKKKKLNTFFNFSLASAPNFRDRKIPNLLVSLTRTMASRDLSERVVPIKWTSREDN